MNLVERLFSCLADYKSETLMMSKQIKRCLGLLLLLGLCLASGAAGFAKHFAQTHSAPALLPQQSVASSNTRNAFVEICAVFSISLTVILLNGDHLNDVERAQAESAITPS